MTNSYSLKYLNLKNNNKLGVKNANVYGGGTLVKKSKKYMKKNIGCNILIIR
jgi:hypothetical protein